VLVRVLKAFFSPARKPHPAGGGDAAKEHPAAEDADFAEAYRHYRARDLKAARDLLEALLSRQADHLDALCLLGDIEAREQRFDSSLACYRKALLIDPRNPEALFGLGLTLHDVGDLEQAYSYLEQARRYRPRDARILTHLGLVLFKLGNLAAAQDRIAQAIRLDPKAADAWNNLGVIQRKLGRIAEAVESFRKARELNPDFGLALTNHGLALRDTERVEEAEKALREAVNLRPGNAAARLNLGSVLQDLGQLDDARLHLEKATELRPEMVEAHVALGSLLQKEGRFDEARAKFQYALSLAPNSPEARSGLAELQLALGEFEEAWDNYEARMEAWDSPRRVFPYPEWGGEPLAGKTLLVYAEQGLGDIVLFASCLPDVIRQAGHCVIDVHPRLSELFEYSFSQATVHGGGGSDSLDWLTGAPPIDYYAAIGSLPRYFRRSAAAFPSHEGYLKARPERVRFWRERLKQTGPGRKVGIAWQGGLARTGKLLRSMALTDWLPLLETPNIDWISLQHTGTEAELNRFAASTGIKIHHWPEALKDYHETAALVSGLDLVITVCCSLVHLTGALGKPVWGMVPTAPSWRYLARGERLPWYPSTRLFRQNRPGDWRPVVDEIRKCLNDDG